MCGCMKKSMTAVTSAQAEAIVNQVPAPKTETDQHAPEPAYANASAE